MGVEKHRLIKEGEKHGAATQIALDAGLLKECPYHNGTLIDKSSDDNTPGYELADKRIWSGELNGVFVSREEMVALVDDAVSDGGARCEECAALSKPD